MVCCKKHTNGVCPEKLVMITNIKIKVTSRYSEYLAIKSFSDRITDKHELETIVTQFQSIESYKTKHANLLCKV